MSHAGRFLLWWLDPWTRVGSAIRSRALRILLLSATLTFTVLPAMMAHYGLDGWLWPLTTAVVACGPLGMLLVDQGMELFERARAPRLSIAIASRQGTLPRSATTGQRLVGLFAGLSLGVLSGYAIVLALPVLPATETALLFRDYRRTMGILGGVFLGMAIVGSLLWYRTEAFRLQASVDQARFRVLKEQMQPHFLFNSLNSLKELISEDPALAEAATQRIADLYRLLLSASEHATMQLDQELGIVENYLEIERIRYRERLRFSIDAEPGTGSLHVPALMLQTLVENAVKHGICKLREGGEVRVRAARRPDGWLELAVFNTGARFVPPGGADDRPRTGLANTVARLELMYGAASGFLVTEDAALGTCVKFAVSGKRVGE